MSACGHATIPFSQPPFVAQEPASYVAPYNRALGDLATLLADAPVIWQPSARPGLPPSVAGADSALWAPEFIAGLRATGRLRGTCGDAHLRLPSREEGGSLVYAATFVAPRVLSGDTLLLRVRFVGTPVAQPCAPSEALQPPLTYDVKVWRNWRGRWRDAVVGGP
jgi:hypothetical protein